MANLPSSTDHNDFNISTSHHQDSFDDSQLLNSSFFSSDSINVMDHSRSFRNSLILRDMSDFNINESLEQSLIESLEDNNKNTAISEKFINNDLNIQQSHLSSNSTSVITGTFNMKRNEIQTANITTSPSLSALAELLNEKSKNAERKMKNSLEIHPSILEEDEEEEHKGNVQSINNEVNQTSSPNLIDLNDEQTPNGNIFVTNMAFTNRNQLPIEQPDFLTSPVVEQKPNYEPNDNINRNLYETNIQTAQESKNISEESNLQATNHENYVHEQGRNKPLEERGENDNRTLIDEPDIVPQSTTKSNWSRMLAHHENNNFRKSNTNIRNHSSLDAGKVVSSEKTNINLFNKPIKKIPTNKQKPINQTKNDNKSDRQKKRRSLFSFFQIKPSNSKNSSETMVRSVSLQDEPDILGKKRASPRRIVTTTSTTLERESNNSKNLPQTFQIYRYRHTSESLTPRKSINDNKDDNNSGVENKNSTPGMLQEPISLHKPRNQQDESTIKNNQINIISLDTNNALNKDDTGTESLSSIDIPTTKNLVNKLQPPKPLSPSVSDIGSRRDSGEVYFPKSLDKEEIDYITQIERTRSIRSSTKRRSIDTLSIKAQNEGMTIFEPSDVVLATPDLTKSPTSSILKNIGTFDNSEISHDLSLGSIEEKLNELSLAFDEEPNEILDLNTDNTFLNTPNHSNETPKNRKGHKESVDDDEENDLMKDIMEFANIIDFGDNLNLDLDLNFNNDDVDAFKDQPKTFNPKFMKGENLSETSSMNNQSDNFDNNITFQNSGLGLQFEHDNMDINNTKFTDANIRTQYDTPLVEPLEVVETEDFNNETFNAIDFKNKTEQQMDQNHVSITSPHMEVLEIMIFYHYLQ